MSWVRYAAFLAILLAFQFSASAGFFHPFWPPFFGNACEENLCGRGNCSVSKNGTFGYECICEKGWRQARSEEDDDFKFLPCVIPNCTLNYTCANTPSPVQNRSKEANLSIFDRNYKLSNFTTSSYLSLWIYLLKAALFLLYKLASGLIVEVVPATRTRLSRLLANVKRVTIICSIPQHFHATNNVPLEGTVKILDSTLRTHHQVLQALLQQIIWTNRVQVMLR